MVDPNLSRRTMRSLLPLLAAARSKRESNPPTKDGNDVENAVLKVSQETSTKKPRRSVPGGKGAREYRFGMGGMDGSFDEDNYILAAAPRPT